MRLPNGYGSIYKLQGTRRKPWIARITVKWEVVNDKPKQVFSTIGYFETRQKALKALSDYNQNPYDVDGAQITFEKLYEKWSNKHFDKISDSRQRGTKSAFDKCGILHKMKFRDIKTLHLEKVLQSNEIGESTKQQIKILFNQLYKYALKHDIVTKNYAELCDSVGVYETKKEKTIFTGEEVQNLWDNIDIDDVDMILICLYSGMRPSEVTLLEKSKIDLDLGTMIGGIKTESGIDRTIPIHSKIKPLIEKRYYSAAGSTLFDDTNYEKYRYSFKKVMKRLGMKHSPHETRHTFTSAAKLNGVDEYCLKLIVGHSITDITERIYTHRQVDQLKEEIEKVKY